MTIDPFELDRALPSHQERLAAEKQVNVYYVPGADKNGEATFVYAVCSALLHEEFLAAVRLGVIPDYAVVVETGKAPPGKKIKEKIKTYYGFDHEAAAET